MAIEEKKKILRGTNKDLCPGQFVSLILAHGAKDLEEHGNLTEGEWRIYSYLRRNVMVNISGNYCRCEPCLEVHKMLIENMKADPIVLDIYGNEHDIDSIK